MMLTKERSEEIRYRACEGRSTDDAARVKG